MIEPSKYGRRWSHGLSLAAVISLGLWLPVYFLVEGTWPDASWCDLVGAFILIAAFLSLAWLTCTLSEYLEKQDRKLQK